MALSFSFPQEKAVSTWEERIAQLEAELASSKQSGSIADGSPLSAATDESEGKSWEESLSARLQHLDEMQAVTARSMSQPGEESVDGDVAGATHSVDNLSSTGEETQKDQSEELVSQLHAWQCVGSVLETALTQLKDGGDMDWSDVHVEVEAARPCLSAAEQLYKSAQATASEQQRVMARYDEAEETLRSRQVELDALRNELSAALQAKEVAEQRASGEDERSSRTHEELQRLQQLLSEQQQRHEEENSQAAQSAAKQLAAVEKSKLEELERISSLLSSKNEECANLAQQLAAEQAVNKTEVGALSSELA